MENSSWKDLISLQKVIWQDFRDFGMIFAVTFSFPKIWQTVAGSNDYLRKLHCSLACFDKCCPENTKWMFYYILHFLPFRVSPSLVKRRKTHFHRLPCGANVILGKILKIVVLLDRPYKDWSEMNWTMLKGDLPLALSDSFPISL